FQLPILIAGAQNIFNETSLGWLDRQDELRNWFRWSKCRQGMIDGGGADLPGPVKAPVPVCPNAGAGFWIKTIGSWTDRREQQSLASLVPAASVLNPFTLDYRQNTFAVYGGLDFGKEAVFGPSDAVVFSVIGGYIDSELKFKA